MFSEGSEFSMSSGCNSDTEKLRNFKESHKGIEVDILGNVLVDSWILTRLVFSKKNIKLYKMY